MAYGCLAGRPDTDFFAVFDGPGEPPPPGIEPRVLSSEHAEGACGPSDMSPSGSRAEADFAAWYVHRCTAHELADLATVNFRPTAVLVLHAPPVTTFPLQSRPASPQVAASRRTKQGSSPGFVQAMLERVFQQTSDAMRASGYGVQSGTTAVVALVLQDVLYVANAGDANAVLYSGSGAAECLTVEHKASDPAEQVKSEAHSLRSFG